MSHTAFGGGPLVHVGDLVRLTDGLEGVVVAVLDSGQFSPDYPASDWACLRAGILVETVEAGLVHYPDMTCIADRLGNSTT